MRTVASMGSLIVLTAMGVGAFTLAPEIVGKWEGSTKIVVVWCEQPDLEIAVVIHSDGSVSGTVGDATLRNGKLVRTGWLGRILGNRNEWIMQGALEGPIVEREGIARKSVNIPFRLENGELHGGLHTNGWTFGGRDRGIISTAGMILR